MSCPTSYIPSVRADSDWSLPSASASAPIVPSAIAYSDRSLFVPDHGTSAISDTLLSSEQVVPSYFPSTQAYVAPIAIPQPPAFAPSAALSGTGTGPAAEPLPGSFPTSVQLLNDLTNARLREIDAVEARVAPAGSTAFTPTSAPCNPSDGHDSVHKRMRHQALSENLGFPVTDPDTVSSHDKKRNYLECLELYVQYLHEQLELAGRTPPKLARIESYKGLSSRSVRTILVHMRDNNRTLHGKVLDREREFLDLFDQFSSEHEG